jgi:hypothetical protein
MSLSVAPIITMIEITPNPVNASSNYVIKVSIEEATYDRLSDYTHSELEAYTHAELGTEKLT